MSQNTISIVGTVATTPRLITAASGVPICSFRLAQAERRYDPEEQKWVDGDTNWFGVTAFRSLAENAGRSIRKGERVFVTGRVRVRQWENGERSGTSVEIDADALGHDLRWGVSRFEKQRAATQAPAPDPAEAEGAASGEQASSERAPDGFLPAAA